MGGQLKNIYEFGCLKLALYAFIAPFMTCSSLTVELMWS